MISKKCAYQLRALLRKCIENAEDSVSGCGVLSSTKSRLGLSVDILAGQRTVGTYIGYDYIEMSDKSTEDLGQYYDSWGDNTMPSEWWCNGMAMPRNPCVVTLDTYEESCFQFEVMCSGAIPEESMYGLLIRAILNDLITDGMCVMMQLEPFGLTGKIDPANVNDLIDDAYFKHFKTPVVPYD